MWSERAAVHREDPRVRAGACAKEEAGVVLPAYDEAETIGDVVCRLREAPLNLVEVLVVDDGSTDGTAAVARAAGAKVIRHERNRGKGEALRTGLRASSAAVVVFLDADGQDDVADIPALLAALEPDVAMVIGSRFAGTLLDGAITPLNRFGNRLLTGIFNALYGSRLGDTQAGFRVVRRNSIEPGALRARSYDIETEMLIHVLQRGGRVVEVPVTRHPRRGGATSFAPFYHGTRILRTMVRCRLHGRGVTRGGHEH